MNKTIEIEIKNRIAWQTNKEEYICGNGDFKVDFKFDEEWDSVEDKTARFAFGDKHIDVSFVGNSCEIPMVDNVSYIEIGVYSDKFKTTGAVVKCKRTIGKSGRAESAPSGVYKKINLEDRATGKKYTIYVQDGKLMMEEA
jgi:hypothetical protein